MPALVFVLMVAEPRRDRYNATSGRFRDQARHCDESEGAPTHQDEGKRIMRNHQRGRSWHVPTLLLFTLALGALLCLPMASTAQGPGIEGERGDEGVIGAARELEVLGHLPSRG